MKTKLCLVFVVMLAIWGMKRYYADAGADDLWWILNPTARLAGVMTGSAFAMAPGEGYFSHERLFLIEKSCAGINFMIAAFGMLTFTLLQRAGSCSAAASVLGVSLLTSYLTTVLVNAARIAIGMWLAALPVTLSTLTAAQVHRFEGIAVYFAGLALLYDIVQRFDRGAVLHRSGR